MIGVKRSRRWRMIGRGRLVQSSRADQGGPVMQMFSITLVMAAALLVGCVLGDMVVVAVGLVRRLHATAAAWGTALIRALRCALGALEFALH